jgi:hypothetical protein
MSVSTSPASRRAIASLRWCPVSFGLRPKITPLAFARARPSPVRVRISSRSNSARPPSTVSMRRPCAVVVSAPSISNRFETCLLFGNRALARTGERGPSGSQNVFNRRTRTGCKRFERDAGAVYKKRAGVFSRHHDDTMMRDENRAKKYEKYLILLNNKRA